MTKSLYIPKSKKISGLVVYCLRCKTNVYEYCKDSEKHLPLRSCRFGDKHRFKLYLQVPRSSKRITKTFETRDLNQAIIEAVKFKESLRENNFRSQKTEQPKITVTETTPLHIQPQISANSTTEAPLLIEAFSRHISFLSGDETVVSFQRRSRSVPYCKEVERCYLKFVDILKRSSYPVQSLRMNEINKQMVGIFYEHLQSELKYSARSLNKNIGFLSSLFTWLLREGYDVRNPFAIVVRKPEYHNPQAITKEEFEALIKITTTERGIQQGKGVKSHRNIYRNYLVPGFHLILYSGRRREEVINMRYSDIVRDKAGNLITIAVPDRKVNAIQGRTEENKKINYVPITEQLFQLLKELGYERYKDTDKFILAPEIQVQRNKVMADNLSRAFSHYFKQVSDRNLSLKSIRKAYLTSVNLYTGGNAKIISGHSGNAVLETHYLDKEFIAKSLRNFEVFGDKGQVRSSELSGIRENQKNQSISLEK